MRPVGGNSEEKAKLWVLERTCVKDGVQEPGSSVSTFYLNLERETDPCPTTPTTRCQQQQSRFLRYVQCGDAGLVELEIRSATSTLTTASATYAKCVF